MPGTPQPSMIYTRILDPDFCARAEGAYHLCVLHSTLFAPLLTPPPPFFPLLRFSLMPLVLMKGKSLDFQKIRLWSWLLTMNFVVWTTKIINGADLCKFWMWFFDVVLYILAVFLYIVNFIKTLDIGKKLMWAWFSYKPSFLWQGVHLKMFQN
jgi:hypothetical protein